MARPKKGTVAPVVDTSAPETSLAVEAATTEIVGGDVETGGEVESKTATAEVPNGPAVGDSETLAGTPAEAKESEASPDQDENNNFEKPVEEKRVKEETVSKKSNSIFVALNHPQGIKFKMPDGRRVEIKGNATHLRGKEKGALPDKGSYGLTQVDRDDWEFIQEVYGGMAIFKNGLIFSADRKADAADEAEDRSETRHGREAVDTSKTNTEEADGVA